MSLLSLCQKAGYIKAGQYAVDFAISEGDAYLVMLGKNSNDIVKKKATSKAYYNKVPCAIFGTKEALAWATGRDNTEIIAIIDEGMANQLKEKINELEDVEL